MQLPVLKAMLGDEVVQQLIRFWPDRYFHAHGPLHRLPAPFSDTILSSIPALAEAYQGRLLEFDPCKDKNRMYCLAEGTRQCFKAQEHRLKFGHSPRNVFNM
jgi:hypothetical protein